MGEETAMQDPLVGKAFLCFKRKNKPKWQGEVAAKVRDGYYLIRIIPRTKGGPTVQRLVSMDELMDWVFFDSEQDREIYLERRQDDAADTD
ncbi:MAG: hypothetical protein PVG82_02905 [Chromatiales bacterium]|jgi:hypothetical protein